MGGVTRTGARKKAAQAAVVASPTFVQVPAAEVRPTVRSALRTSSVPPRAPPMIGSPPRWIGGTVCRTSARMWTARPCVSSAISVGQSFLWAGDVVTTGSAKQ